MKTIPIQQKKLIKDSKKKEERNVLKEKMFSGIKRLLKANNTELSVKIEKIVKKHIKKIVKKTIKKNTLLPAKIKK